MTDSLRFPYALGAARTFTLGARLEALEARRDAAAERADPAAPPLRELAAGNPPPPPDERPSTPSPAREPPQPLALALPRLSYPGLPDTGERFVPDGRATDTGFEHLHRYLLATRLAPGLRIADIGSGAGYGSALLAQAGGHVVGLDISPQAVGSACRVHGGAPGLSFAVGDAERLPLATAGFDLLTCFETIEHLRDPRAFIAEARRVLAPEGTLLISTPNPQAYAQARGGLANPWHLSEMDPAEFTAALSLHFPCLAMHGQRVVYGSFVWGRHASGAAEPWFDTANFGLDRFATGADARPTYLVAAASARPVAGFERPAMLEFAGFANPMASLQGGIADRDATIMHLEAELRRLVGVDAPRGPLQQPEIVTEGAYSVEAGDLGDQTVDDEREIAVCLLTALGVYQPTSYNARVGPPEAVTSINGMRITFPAQCYVKARVADIALAEPDEGLDHLVLQIGCQGLSSHPKAELWMAVKLAGTHRPGDIAVWRQMYTQHRRSHSFLIPFERLRAAGGGEVSLEIEMETGSLKGAAAEDIGRFELSLYVMRSAAVMASLAERLVFVFSTARSGSTWIASDLMDWRGNNRVVDEPGLGMMVAPLQWDAERNFDLGGLRRHVPSGMGYEAKEIERDLPADRLPPFERVHALGATASWFYRPDHRDRFLEMVRHMVLDHVVIEWGLFDYERVIVKLPNESHAADFLLAALPECRAMHLVRDGRDVMSSRFGAYGSGILSKTDRPGLRWHAIAYYSHLWNFQNDIIAEACKRHATGQVLLLRYEDIRGDSLAKARSTLAWMGQPLEPEQEQALLRQMSFENAPAEEVGFGKRRGDGEIGRFSKMFSPQEVELMVDIMRPQLLSFGYLAEPVAQEGQATPLSQTEEGGPGETSKVEMVPTSSNEFRWP